MRQRGSVALTLVLIVFLAIIGYFIYPAIDKPQVENLSPTTTPVSSGSQEENTSSTANPASDESRSISSFEEIFLWPEVEWEKEENHEFKSAIYYSNQKLGDEGVFGDTTVYGTYWKSVNTALTIDSLNLINVHDFSNHYNNLAKNGDWAQNLSYQNFRIMPLFADGPGTSTFGYLDSKHDDKVKAIILSWAYISPFEHTEDGMKFICPCTLELSVFVSKPILLSDILPKN